MASSNLTSQPSWLEIVPNEDKPDDTFYGFNDTGLWITGNSGGEDMAYPVRTNYDIDSEAVTTVVFTYNLQGCSDQGVCFFAVGTEPRWEWGPNETRVSFLSDCGWPHIAGLTHDSGEGGEPPHLDDGIYTAVFIYNPGEETFTLSMYAGSAPVSGDPIFVTTVNERLPAGPYRIGLDADNDEFPENPEARSYYTYLQIGDTSAVPSIKPAITFRVKTYDPVQFNSMGMPAIDRDNLILLMKNKTVWIPPWPAPLKHDDTFTLYGYEAIRLRNQLNQLNSNGTVLVEESYVG